MSSKDKSTTIGIIGGGQLARMMALAGLPMGLRLRVYDPSADACAGHIVPLTQGRFDDCAALVDFSKQLDVVTFDFENVPAASVAALTAVAVHPGALALATAQDRLSEKTCFNRLGIPTPKFLAVHDRAGLDTAIAQLGAPAILKTRRLGYDGKGQYRLRSADDTNAAWAALGDQADKVGLILEAFVAFRRELSVVAVRAKNGEFASWPITENWHVDGVLSASLAPARVDAAIADQAISYARTLAESLDYVGVFALELFDCGNELLANEMAPRVHNSGHWSIEGAETSQFENHLRAIVDWPLGDTSARGYSCMLNFLGAMPPAVSLLNISGAHWHNYGKAEREGRKVGHATLRAKDKETLAKVLDAAGASMGRQAQVAPVIARLREP